jgi:hypothetical protein
VALATVMRTTGSGNWREYNFIGTSLTLFTVIDVRVPHILDSQELSISRTSEHGERLPLPKILGALPGSTTLGLRISTGWPIQARDRWLNR